MSDETAGSGVDEVLEPRIEADQDGEQRLRLTATGHGQRVVVVLDDGLAREFADDVLEIVEGPLMHRAGPPAEGSAVGRHPSTRGLLRWFEHGHLPPHLAAVSAPVGDLARLMVARLPDGAELTTGLRKLLEAKDALVRAAIELDGAGPEHGGRP